MWVCGQSLNILLRTHTSAQFLCLYLFEKNTHHCESVLYQSIHFSLDIKMRIKSIVGCDFVSSISGQILKFDIAAVNIKFHIGDDCNVLQTHSNHFRAFIYFVPENVILNLF